MAPPLYFFARKQLGDVVRDDRLLPSILEATGMQDALGDVGSVSAETCCNEIVKAGPGGASGVLLTPLPATGQCPPRIGYAPDFQDWIQAGAYLWVGVDREHPPTPADLIRRAGRPFGADVPPLHAGYVATLAGGHRWLIPVIRRPAFVARHGRALTELPMDIGWDLEGRFAEAIKPEYQPIFHDAAGLCDLFYEPDGAPRVGEFEISTEAGLKWCLRILGLNYRYGPAEQRALRVVDTTNVFVLLGLAVDTPACGQLATIGSTTEV